MEHLRQLLEHLPLAAQLWDKSGTVLFTNRLFNRLFRLPADAEWSSSSEMQALPGSWNIIPLEAACREALAGKHITLDGVFFRFQAGDNEDSGEHPLTLVLDLQVIPMQAGPEQVTGAVCLAREHSSSATMVEDEMMRTQRMENLETLAASVSHEFNNIFTGIRGLADLIRDESEPGSDIFEFASSIQSSVLRGADLVARLSSFAQELPHQLRPRSLNAYVEKALPILQLQATKRVQVEFRPGEDLQVKLDASRMDQALANLISNARDAIGGVGRIRVSTGLLDIGGGGRADDGPSPHWAFIQVEDSGPGIPIALRSQVTEPFFTTKEKGKATGLGLAMTCRIVSLHNGRLEIDDSPELGGASIRILLPATRSAQL